MAASVATPDNVIALEPTVAREAEHASALSESFERFFGEHFSYVVHNLRRLGVRERDVDDVAQDVFVSVHRRFADYDPSRSTRAWLFSFIAHTAANYRRLARHRLEQELTESSLSSSGVDPEASAVRAAQSTLVREVLLSMKEDRRTALIMHDLNGLTAPEIAHALEIPLNTVYSRVRRARDDFRRLARTRLKGDDR